MWPTVENIQTFSAICIGIALLLSLLLFIARKLTGRKIKWGGFAVFALAAYGLPIVGIVAKYLRDRKALQHEATTSGIVVAHDPPNHNQYQFEYVVSGQRHYAWHRSTTTCDAGDIFVGKTVTVFYDPLHVEKADLCSFRGALTNDLQVFGLLCGMLIFTTIGTAWQQRRK